MRWKAPVGNNQRQVMKIYFLPIFLLLLLSSSCDGIVSNEVALNKEFDLKLGEQAVLIEENLTLIFKDVTEDSRCPEDVLCIWTGNVSLQFLSQNNTSIVNTYSDPHSFEIEGYKIKLISLSPYPNSKKPIKKEDYQARLLITKN